MAAIECLRVSGGVVESLRAIGQAIQSLPVELERINVCTIFQSYLAEQIIEKSTEKRKIFRSVGEHFFPLPSLSWQWQLYTYIGSINSRFD